MSRKYDSEQMAFFREHIPNHNWKETADAFEERFGERLSRSQIRHVRKYHGIHPEHRGAPKGTVPPQGSKFKVGDEKLDDRGYTWVKVCESRYDERHGSNKKMLCWRYKHHLAWEEAHGTPLPEGQVVMFADRDKGNFDPANLVAVPLEVSKHVNRMKVPYHDADTLQACVTLARIRIALKERRRDD